jgi:tyrosyl-tRNA synthetase
MNIDEKINLITRNLEEVLTIEDLKKLVEKRKKLIHYIGFEVSGLLHLGSGILSSLKIIDLLKAGVRCQIFLADWHTWINEKLDGKLETIRKIGVGYYKEGFKACIDNLGGDSSKVDFILGTELYHNADDYWLLVIDIAKNVTLARDLRSVDILGRKAREGIDMAKLIYPLMQVADIFYLNVNLAHAGMDQRKAHVIAIDVAKDIKREKPIALHQHILLGLQKPPKYPLTEEEVKEMKIDLKMSKSKPDTGIFIHDSEEEIERKIMKAFCPPNDTIYNPVIDWLIWLILPIKKEVQIKTTKGSTKTYDEEKKKEFLDDYKEGLIHPMDLKETVIKELINILKPINNHFKKGKAKTYLKSILKFI